MRALCVFVFIFACAFCDNKDGGRAPLVPLSDGTSIPGFGLGTFLGFDENGQKEVKEHDVDGPITLALAAGYRSSDTLSYKVSPTVSVMIITHDKAATVLELLKNSGHDEPAISIKLMEMIDTAQAYKNEEQVGLAVRGSAVPRENIYVVTKLAPHKQRMPVEALRESLAKMNLSYVDLYLIHNPVGFTPDDKKFDVVDYVDIWRGMEEARGLGLTKSIGISNFNISQMERLLSNCRKRPTVLQVEVNLNLAQNKILEFCKKEHIVVMAYSPFGTLFNKMDGPAPKINDPTLNELAAKYKKTVPQIVLRYLIQHGVIPIPKSVNKDRIEENINIFDFELTNEEMETLSKFNKDYRTVFPSFWQDHPYYPYERTDTPAADIFKRD